MSTPVLSSGTMRLVKKIENGDFILPGIPEVSEKIRKAVKDDNVNVADLSSLIEQDPVLSARIVSMVNSPAMRTPVKINSVKSAVSRMGLSFAGNAAIGLAMEQAFKAINPVISKEMNHHWFYTNLVANAAIVIAKSIKSVPVEEVMLAALLHHIGALALLKYADSDEELSRSVDERKQIISEASGMVGDFAICVWDLPEQYSSLARDIHDFEGVKDVSMLVHVIRVAICLVGLNYKVPVPLPEWMNIPSFQVLGLPADSDSPEIQELLAEFVD